jgi:hypothetical protein
MNGVKANPSNENDNSEQLPLFAQHVLDRLGSWSKWLGLNRAA